MNEKLNICDQSKAYVDLITAKLQLIAPNRFSSALVNQIAYFPYNGMNEAYQFILPEILHLENPDNPSDTKAPQKFARPAMCGLWKKHFFLPNYIAPNCSNYWKLKSSKSKKFEQHFEKYWAEYTEDPTEEKAKEVSSKIASDFANIPQIEFTAGKRKKTGEYIVFKKHEGLNYYLCLGQHQHDDEIIEWVNESYKELSFLKPQTQEG